MMNIKSIVLILVGVLFLSSCERALIPESRFSDIYHDILLADYYVGSTNSLITSTDSIVAYQGIIESHGYTLEQFIFAQNWYIAHPEELSKMMKSLQKRLKEETSELQKQFDLERDAELQARADSLGISKDSLTSLQDSQPFLDKRPRDFRDRE